MLGKLWGSAGAIKDITSAVINTGDKLVYTDEEKAENKKEVIKFFPTLLQAYHPFKLAQRILATWFSLLYGFAFIAGVTMEIINIYIKYEALKNKVPLNEIILLDTAPLINIVGAFSLGTIVLTIVGFYFLGGSIESFKNIKK